MAVKNTDFSKILSELREKGITDYMMSNQTGIDRSLLTKLRTGQRKQTNYDVGVEIMRIYKKEIKKQE